MQYFEELINIQLINLLVLECAVGAAQDKNLKEAA
jgi:hypothetical protein